jgi:16S rRNA (guanine966-N2)-methyltransferase
MQKVRIIGGRDGGRWIATPGRESTHVMGDRIRSAIFNMIECDGKTVLDAYAGSGALGLEALSRGATHATFIEKNRKAAETVVKNTTLLNDTARAEILNISVADFLKTLENSSEKFDLIFADPPYDRPDFPTTLRLLSHLNLNGLMILSHIGKMCVPSVRGVVVVDKREYGNATIEILKRQ